MFRFIASILFSVVATVAAAADTDWGDAQLIPGWASSDGEFFAAVTIDLNPGWKTYWRVPGAAGIPPLFNWTGSQNLRKAEVLFPVPEAETIGGLQSIGYHGSVVFPIRVEADSPGSAVDLSLDFTFGVCEEICIPAQQSFVLRLEPGSEANRELIENALARQPSSAAQAGVTAVCELRPDGDNFALAAKIGMPIAPAALPVVVFETPSPDIWLDVAAVRREGGGLVATAPLQFYGSGGLVLDRSEIRLTLLGADGAIDITGCPAG